jgi:hypothetical protein
MPLVSNGSGVGAHPAIVVPGVYQYLRDRADEMHSQPDPRATVGATRPLTDGQRAAFRRAAGPGPLLAALRAGRDVTLPSWRALPGNKFPGVRDTLPWATKAVRVSADDRVRPGLRQDVVGY